MSMLTFRNRQGALVDIPTARLERLMAEQQYRGRLFGDLSAVTQANRPGIVPKILAHAEWEGRLLNGSDYPLPGILPLFSLKALVKEGVLAESVVAPLHELRESNSVLFDFVLKRNLALRGRKLPDSAFETRDFFMSSRAPAGNDPGSRS